MRWTHATPEGPAADRQPTQPNRANKRSGAQRSRSWISPTPRPAYARTRSKRVLDRDGRQLAWECPRVLAPRQDAVFGRGERAVTDRLLRRDAPSARIPGRAIVWPGDARVVMKAGVTDRRDRGAFQPAGRARDFRSPSYRSRPRRCPVRHSTSRRAERSRARSARVSGYRVVVSALGRCDVADEILMARARREPGRGATSAPATAQARAPPRPSRLSPPRDAGTLAVPDEYGAALAVEIALG